MVKFKFIFVVLFLLIIEVSFISSIQFVRIKPDLLLIITCYAALVFGLSTGLFVGILSGFLSDAFSGGVMGSMIIASVICVFLIAAVRRNLYKEHLTTRFSVVWVSSYVFAYVSTNITNIVSGVSMMPLLNLEYFGFALINLAFSCLLIPLLDLLFKIKD